MHVIKLDSTEIKPFLDILSRGSEIPVASGYELARYDYDGNRVIVYNTGKVVMSDFPSRSFADEIVSLFESFDDLNMCTIGTDEAGKGELVGPIVACAVLLAGKRERALARLYGAMDSKQLSSSQIIEVRNRLRVFKYGISIISPKEFNHVFDNNLNHILSTLHVKSISSLSKYVEGPCKIIIDKFGGKDVSQFLTENVKQVFGDLASSIVLEPHAEIHPSVSCASIIAKYEYEKWLASYGKSLGIDLHNISYNSVRDYDTSVLSEVCKLKYLNRKQ